MKHRWKKAAAIVLSLCMCLNLMQLNVGAFDSDKDKSRLELSVSDILETFQDGADQEESTSEEETKESSEEETTESEAEESSEAETTESKPEESSEAETTESEAEESSEAETTESEAEESSEAETTESEAEENSEVETTESESETSSEVETENEETDSTEETTESEPVDGNHSLRACFEWSSDHQSCAVDYVCDICGTWVDGNRCVITTESISGGIRYIATDVYMGITYTDYYDVYYDDTSGTHSNKMWYRYAEGAMDIRGYSNNGVIQTTFENGGYHTVLLVDQSLEELYFSGNNVAVNHSSGLTVTPEISFLNDYAVVTLTIRNTTGNTKYYSLNINADVDIDNDDCATLQKTNTGLKMVNANNNMTFYLACRNISGIKNVDTLWIGKYPTRQQHYFEESSDSTLSGVDSEFNCAWVNRTLAPGASVSYSYEVGIGQGDEIQAPEEVNQHEFNAPVFNWNNDYNVCTATFTCKAQDCDFTATENCIVSQNVTAATCTQDGKTVYTAGITYEGQYYSDQKTVEGAKATGHSYGQPSFYWGEDNSTCIAGFTCSSCWTAENVNCVVTDSISSSGEITYTAVATFEGKTYSDNKTVVKEVHVFGNPTFTWQEDGSSCGAVFICENCEETETVTCTITEETVEATCAEEGKVTYTATAVMDGKSYTDEKIVAITKTDHVFGQEKFNWLPDGAACTVDFTCTNCSQTESVACEIETVDVGYQYIARAEFEGENYTDTLLIETVAVMKDSTGDYSDDSTDGKVTIAVHEIGSGQDLTFECSIPLKYFINVEVDGKLVDPSYYTLAEGSTILTFLSAYLDTKSVGKHDVAMNYNINGRKQTVTTNFQVRKQTVKEPTKEITPSPVKPNNPPTPPTQGNTESKEPVNNAVENRPVPMTAHLVDKNGVPMQNYTLEMHSTPMTSVINADGMASFKQIEAGDHMMYLKDTDGNTIASKAVKIAFADGYSLSGNVINIQAGRSFTLHVQYADNALILLSVEGGSPITGDSTDMMIWVVLMLSALGGMVVLVVKKRKHIR